MTPHSHGKHKGRWNESTGRALGQRLPASIEPCPIYWREVFWILNGVQGPGRAPALSGPARPHRRHVAELFRVPISRMWKQLRIKHDALSHGLHRSPPFTPPANIASANTRFANSVADPTSIRIQVTGPFEFNLRQDKRLHQFQRRHSISHVRDDLSLNRFPRIHQKPGHKLQRFPDFHVPPPQ